MSKQNITEIDDHCNPTLKKATSERRKTSSRDNGAKSKGPVTPEGKARAGQNGVSHGLLAAHLTLTDEDAVEFEELRGEYMRRFQPRDPIEVRNLEEVIRHKWQLRQCWFLENRVLALQMTEDEDHVAENWEPLSEFGRRTLAFVASVRENNALALLQRYGCSLAGQANRALKEFERLRRAPEPEFRREPSPISEHPGTDAPVDL